VRLRLRFTRAVSGQVAEQANAGGPMEVSKESSVESFPSNRGGAPSEKGADDSGELERHTDKN
jgi:hypothetical protein